MRRTSHRIAIAAALASVASLGFAGTAAAEVECGGTITQDTTLTHDVGPCTGDGITIGASGTASKRKTATNPITLDLNGHTVIGTGGSRGVVVDGQTYVEIKGSGTKITGPGTVTAFERGVSISGSTNVTVSSLTSSANAGAGVFIGGGPSSTTYGSGNTVDNVTVELALGTVLSDYGEGIQINDSDGNTVKNSTVSLSGPYSGITLLGDSDYNKIGVAGGANTVENNIEPSGTSNQDDGIRLEPDYAERTNPDNNRIENNVVRGNGLDGIAIFAAAVPSGGAPLACVTTANKVLSNTVEDNGFHTYAHRRGDGIRIFPRACGNTVDANTVTGNAGNGIRIDGPFKNKAGIVLAPGSLNNTITNNDPVSGNSVFPGYHDLSDGNDQCDNNSWSGNDPDASRNQSCIG